MVTSYDPLSNFTEVSMNYRLKVERDILNVI